MDKMPFKANGHGRKDDDENTKSEPAQAERPVRITPRPVVASETVVVQDAKRSVGLVVAVAVLYVAVVVFALVYFLTPKGVDTSLLPVIDSSKYQAVTLANGDIYIGKMSFENRDYAKLQDVFYLSPILESDKTASTSDTPAKNNFNLNKFTEIAYNPDDDMTIPRSQITHFENLKSGGKVAQLIQQYKKQN